MKYASSAPVLAPITVNPSFMDLHWASRLASSSDEEVGGGDGESGDDLSVGGAGDSGDEGIDWAGEMGDPEKGKKYVLLLFGYVL